MQNLLKNWKTTLSGVITAIAGFVAFAPQHFGGEDSLIVSICSYITAGGLAVIGIFARDAN